jgi:hypothetical protein
LSYGPPNTSFTYLPATPSPSRRVRFVFRSSQPGSTFRCSTDNAPYTRCASPFRAQLKVGSHRFRVVAVNAFGAGDPTPAVYRFRISRGR